MDIAQPPLQQSKCHVINLRFVMKALKTLNPVCLFLSTLHLQVLAQVGGNAARFDSGLCSTWVYCRLVRK